MNPDLIRRVWQQANSRCEYCHLPATFHPAPFQIDHIIARQHGGRSEDQNLALSCPHCNRYKGPNIAAAEPETGELTHLFHPRTDAWTEHLAWDGIEPIGRTPAARTTIAVSNINDPEVIVLRKALREEGVSADWAGSG